MRFTRDEFIKVVGNFETMFSQCLKLQEAMVCSEWIGNKWVDQYWDLMYDLCDLKPGEADDFDFFIFDLDFGRKWAPGIIKDGDGSDIPLRNAEELWDWFTKEN